ncbi:hypothetical protein Ahia01_001241300 [Argonauta hians]
MVAVFLVNSWFPRWRVVDPDVVDCRVALTLTPGHHKGELIGGEAVEAVATGHQIVGAEWGALLVAPEFLPDEYVEQAEGYEDGHEEDEEETVVNLRQH